MSEIAKLLESYNVLIVSVSLLLMTLVILNIDIKQLFVGLFLVAFFGVSIYVVHFGLMTWQTVVISVMIFFPLYRIVKSLMLHPEREIKRRLNFLADKYTSFEPLAGPQGETGGVLRNLLASIRSRFAAKKIDKIDTLSEGLGSLSNEDKEKLFRLLSIEKEKGE